MFAGIKCPVCNKFVLPDDIECHLVMCLTKPRLSYNGNNGSYRKRVYHITDVDCFVCLLCVCGCRWFCRGRAHRCEGRVRDLLGGLVLRRRDCPITLPMRLSQNVSANSECFEVYAKPMHWKICSGLTVIYLYIHFEFNVSHFSSSRVIIISYRVQSKSSVYAIDAKK